MGTSKNSKKGSQIKEVFKVKRVKPKKSHLLIEVTQKVYENLKQSQDLSYYNDGNKTWIVEDIITRFGKTYLKVVNQ